MIKNFEGWCYSIGMDDARIVSCDMVSMEVLKECWDYKEKDLTKKYFKKFLLKYPEPRSIGEAGYSYMRDKIELLQKELAKEREKSNKLERLMLLVDTSVSDIVVGDTQVRQWGEFLKVYPDTVEKQRQGVKYERQSIRKNNNKA